MLKAAPAKVNKYSLGMKLKQPKETPSRLRALESEMEDTPPIQQKVRCMRYTENENEDNANFVVEFRRRTKDNQLYHSHEFNKPPLQQSLVCNEVYDNNDFFKKSLQDDRDLRKGWVLTQSQENLLQKKPRLDSSINFRSMRPKNNLTQSREFLEEKQIVNDVIDDLIKKNQKSYKDLRAPVREPMKEYMKESMKESLKEPIKESIKETRTLMCSNEDGKKAKYRMEDPDEELYYCSKCSIMLLQKGFQVTELEPSVKPSQPRRTPNPKLKEEFEGLRFKMQCLKESIRQGIVGIQSIEQDSRIESQQIKINDIYELIISVADSMRKKDLGCLMANVDGQNRERNKNKAGLQQKIAELDVIEGEIDGLDFSAIEDDQGRNLLVNMSKTVDILNHEPSTYMDVTMIEEPLECRLERLVSEVKQQYPKGSIDFSFQGSEKLHNLMKETRQPFRHLFTDDDEPKEPTSSRFSKIPCKENVYQRMRQL